MEVYGTKPKRFTRAWWDYFWYYYKWHTISVLFALTVLLCALGQCAAQTDYDLQIDFISEYALTDDTRSALTTLVCENIDDANANGKVDAFVLDLNMNPYSDSQTLQLTQTNYTLEAGHSDSFVFIMSKKFADNFAENGVFIPVREWLEDGSEGYIVSLADNEMLKNIGIDANESDLYIGVRNLRDKEKDNKDKAAEYANAVKLAKKLTERK